MVSARTVMVAGGRQQMCYLQKRITARHTYISYNFLQHNSHFEYLLSVYVISSRKISFILRALFKNMLILISAIWWNPICFIFRIFRYSVRLWSKLAIPCHSGTWVHEHLYLCVFSIVQDHFSPLWAYICSFMNIFGPL